MRRLPPDFFPVVWRDLADPSDPRAPQGQRTIVKLSAQAWNHIVDKHVANPMEPWDDLLSRTVREAVVQHDANNSAVRQAVDRLGEQIRQSLERPLALLYRMAGAGGRRVWLLVLPSGANAVVHVKGRPRLVTCYYPRVATVEDNRECRWRRVVAQLVWRYGKVSGRQVLLPSSDYQVSVTGVDGRKELRRAIRFVTPEMWGFVPNMRGCPWQGQLDVWPAAACGQAHSGRKHGLRPRRSNGKES